MDTEPANPSSLNDGQLLAAFVATEREAPFEELVRRHGPLVYNACLRVLQQDSDAEDAAQAVFLALSHRAHDRGLQARAELSGWLHETAWHVGLRARAAAKARARREQEAATMQHANTSAESRAQWLQVAPVLDGELHALPEKYRLPIVLHHLEQHSVEQIAALMRCSLDAIRQRLSRGREMLRERLTRRGVKLSGAVVVALLQDHAATATLPATFAASAAKAAALVASGQAVAAGLMSPHAIALARDAATPLARRFARPLAAAILAALLIGIYAAVAARTPAPAIAVRNLPTAIAIQTQASTSTSTATSSDSSAPVIEVRAMAKTESFGRGGRTNDSTPDAPKKPDEVKPAAESSNETAGSFPAPPLKTKSKSEVSGPVEMPKSAAPVVEIHAQTPPDAATPEEIESIARKITISGSRGRTTPQSSQVDALQPETRQAATQPATTGPAPKPDQADIERR